MIDLVDIGLNRVRIGYAVDHHTVGLGFLTNSLTGRIVNPDTAFRIIPFLALTGAVKTSLFVYEAVTVGDESTEMS